MKKLVTPIFILLLIILVSCAEKPDNTQTFSIMIGNSITSRSIGPVYGDADSPANTEVTHYRISLYFSDTEEIDVSGNAGFVSDYLAKKNAKYTFSGILSGKYWAVKVEAYINLTGSKETIEAPENGSLPENLVKVAEIYAGDNQVEELPDNFTITGKLVAGHADNFVDIVIDELATGAGYKGTTLNISMTLPQGLSEDTWYCNLNLAKTINGENLLENNTFTVSSSAEYSKTEADTDGVQYDVYETAIDVSNIDQGIYFLTVNVSNSNTTNPSIIRTAVVPVRIIPGTISKGDIDLSYEIEINEAPLEITDETGKIVELENVKFVFTYSDVGERTLRLSTEDFIDTSDFGDNVNAIYIIDGKLITDPSRTTESPGSPNKKFNCRFEDSKIDAMKGRHIITLIIYNEDNPLIFGSFSDFAEWYLDDQEITVEEVSQ